MQYKNTAEWMQDVCALAGAADAYQWEAAYALLEGHEHFDLSASEWEIAKAEIAGQTNRSAKTVQNWLSVARKWPLTRREVLDIMDVSFTVLAELVGVEDAMADSLATQAAEMAWTRDQVRAELASLRNPASGNGHENDAEAINGTTVTVAAGDGWQWTTVEEAIEHGTSNGEPPYANDEFYTDDGKRRWRLALSGNVATVAADAQMIAEFDGEYAWKLAEALQAECALPY